MYEKHIGLTLRTISYEKIRMFYKNFNINYGKIYTIVYFFK